MEDAEEAIVLIGSSAGTARVCVDALRARGRRVGMIKVRVYRPFPAEELAEALAYVQAVAVMDKCESFSTHGGPLGAELRSALYDAQLHPLLINFVYGLGGRDFAVTDCEGVFDALSEARKTDSAKPVYRHLGQRGGDLHGLAEFKTGAEQARAVCSWATGCAPAAAAASPCALCCAP